ncbi:cytochrome c/FTR1 family iron permease [Sphingobium yanoikuyae]|jgi:high-affinity iron transporter|uniref:Cytochrome c/FTR1 family iron permease n=1 Tax=Sphingobium yanoikuyae TaxID=13690 RepID=A0AA42X0A6_SPHYA|nr:cytochrome c/FTR1 family iron permease [Sphingobium yanoikuyae]MDH2135099.1 cytochrome c/FTR1 family iron permease [Sphingobium yanoikuyae]MDH2153338.1 cytochrome c/FTR1 family iron permease [Sphingobium yanoikuyae]MDH2170446.1 cytochrome c/FTR1 family iron permease [Sphingobium yanoikuyae]
MLTALVGGVALGLAGPALAQTAPAQTAWRLLDYIAVDYPEAVADGKITNAGEYAEMQEFSATAAKLIGELPASSARTGLERQAGDLQRIIAAKASAPAIATAARGLAADLIKAYPVPLAPTIAPDVARGKTLYAQQCASCHGASGKGDGPQARGLDPAPIAFADEARARERSVFALYQVLEQGLDGTSMASFAELPPQDRWALAFYAGSFAYPESEAKAGKTLWDGDADLRQRLDLEKLVGTTPAALAAQVGEDKARQLTAYLRRHPEATVAAEAAGTLTLARARLDAALAAYGRGERKTATDLALSAYLDGFEPVEAVLSARDNTLMVRIEGAMADLRAGIAKSEPVETVKERVATLDGLFADAETALAPSEASATSSFVAAFTILAREGLEALLIVVAMIAFLSKADRRDMLPYVHGGWIAALVAGAATWAAATWLIAISGASRELTEGFGGVFAAIVLLWVGIWMHGKSNADAWQRYIRDKLSKALNRRSAWFLFLLAFVVVYREVFETILFYAAIWGQGNGGAVIAGALAAVALLAVIAVVMMRYSRTLPIGTFFAYSSALIAILAVVLIGKGSAALQEAGYLPVTPWPGLPRSELLGIYPTHETIGAQLVMVVLLVAGFLWNRRSAIRAGRAAA